MSAEPAQQSTAAQDFPTKDGQANARLIQTIQADWALEMDGVAMYQALADRERIP